MQLEKMFDARTVEPQLGYPAPPPLADYHVQITESEGKPVKPPGKGGYLELTVVILDPGSYLNRTVKYILNLYNESQQAVDIAYKQLSAICHVTGQFNIQDSRQLHNVPFIATIGPDIKDPNYSRIFAVKDLQGKEPGKAGQFTQGAPQPPAPPTQAPAWAPAPPVAAAPTPAAWTPPGAPPATSAAPMPAWTPPGAPAPASGNAPWQQTQPQGNKPPWER
jgi:hypothetical protein